MSFTDANRDSGGRTISDLATNGPNDEVTERPVELQTMDAAVAGNWKAGKQVWLIVLCICIVNLVVALDATVLVPALPTIATELDASALSTYWIGTSYLLSNAVVQPVISAISEVYGRRASLLVSIIFFTVGSIVACLANGVPQMLAGRVIQGVGGGGIIVMTLVIITDIVPLRQRPKFLAINMMSWALGTVSGPLIGGAIAQKTTWRWIFYLNFPVCGIGLVMVPFVVRYKRTKSTVLENLAAVDWLGCILFIGGVVSFLMAVSWGGVQYPWKSYQTLVPLLVGLSVIALSLIWAAHFAKHPFIRITIYRKWMSWCAIICTLLQGFLLYLGLYYISLYFLSVQQKSPIETGVAFLPLTLALLPTSIISAIMVTRFGKFQAIAWAGWTIITLGNGLLILLGMHTKTVAWVFIFLVVGVGQGSVVIVLNVALQASVDSKYAPDASAFYTFTRSLGMALGVGIGGAVFQNRLSHQLALAGLPLNISTNADGFLAFLKLLPPSDQAFIDSVLGAFSQAFKNLFEISTAIGGVGLLLSLFIRDADMNQALASRHTLRGESRESQVIDDHVVDDQTTGDKAVEEDHGDHGDDTELKECKFF